MVIAVPLSRFTSLVGGGSAFFVRRHCVYALSSHACESDGGTIFILGAIVELVPVATFPRRHGFGRAWSYRSVLPRHCFVGITHFGSFSLAFAKAVVVGQDSSLACRLFCRHIVDQSYSSFCFTDDRIILSAMTMPPNKSPEPTAVGHRSSAGAVHVVSRRWLSFFR